MSCATCLARKGGGDRSTRGGDFFWPNHPFSFSYSQLVNRQEGMATFQGNRFEELNLLSQFEPNLNLNDFDFNSTSLANKFSSSSSSTPDTTSSWLLNSFNFFFISTLSKHKGIESICRNQEGWGPTSSQRDFDFTPCFQEISLWIAPVALLAIFG